MKKQPLSQSVAAFGALAIFLTFAALALLAIGVSVIATQGKNVTPPSQVPGAANTCFTSCWGFVELQCGDNELIGACFGVWGCDSQTGPHECK
jgi:hypothetical protein